VLDRACDTRTDHLDRRNGIGHDRLGLGASSDAATTQEVDTLVVRDAEQPGLECAAILERVQFSIRLEQRVLHDVLAIEDRAGHARTVSVQAGPQMPDRLEEREVSRLVQTSVGRVG
jgi:hypothetical protein